MAENKFDEVQKFFDDIENSINPKMRKAIIYSVYMNENERIKECSEIENHFNKDGYYKTCIAHKVTDRIFVVEFVVEIFNPNAIHDTRVLFYPYVKYNNDDENNRNSQPDCAYGTFDEAVIAAYSFIYTGNVEAGEWACKLMDIGKSTA